MLNRIWGENFGTRSRYRHSYLYYTSKNTANTSRAQDQYFYSTEKNSHKGRVVYVSGVYRYNASKKEWKAMKTAGHAKKKDAIARAKKLMEAMA